MTCIDKREAQAEISRQHAQLKRLAKAVDSLPDELPGILRVHAGQLQLWLPYDPQIFTAVRRGMGYGWKFGRTYTATNSTSGAYRMRTYTHLATGVQLLMSLETDREGATYRAVKIGEQVEPVFEIVHG
jgi:hypothetical protein